MLSPAVGLQKNTPFWKQLGTGFAAFIGKDFFRYYRLPLEFAEALLCQGSLSLLQPLLPLFNRNNRFYVLAVSKKSVRFLSGPGRLSRRGGAEEPAEEPGGYNEV